MRYCILDPTGNITALVEDHVEVERQPQVALEIMKAHPEVEQVGFVHEAEAEGVHVSLRMAGGEFCGNATMSAAALFALNHGLDGSTRVLVRASGARDVVEVKLQKDDNGGFYASVRMPQPREIRTLRLYHGKLADDLDVVFFDGISHVVIGDDSPLFCLRSDMTAAESTVRAWCEALGADGLGLMFLEHNASDDFVLTPLVYVPGSNTVFWENSCASGSAAVGMCVASVTDSHCDVVLREPGGTLRVTSDPHSGETWLFGHVRKRKTITLD